MISLSGNIRISDGMTFTVDSDLNGASPQFTLTCISTGGPATTVTWTRDSVTVTEGNETVLDNRTTSQYTHTLTVTGRLGGLYKCTVANNRPSNNESSAQLTVQGICSYSSTDEDTWFCMLPEKFTLTLKFLHSYTSLLWLFIAFSFTGP